MVNPLVNNSGRYAGYSLLEVLVVLALVGILAGIAFPSFSDAVQKIALNRKMDAFAAGHRIARSEAVARGTEVSICKSANPADPTPTCGDDSVNWEAGWVVFVNTDRDSPAVIDDGEQVLKVSVGLGESYSLRGTAGIEAFISYNPMGEVNMPGSLILCRDGKVNQARVVYIGTAGRIKQAERNGYDIPVSDDGTPLENCIPT